ncbi:NAD(P)/FAD-dependent oxidoreductase [Sciscionella marina]|uniref:NAD(P)/FAD-dependent oxidoreductase n=1 Tax=Sciscionella marina TaxID=508770 RepID=UPI0004777BAD|nr:NAD(P)/FAD-dependent oxidoreductase [Sciscionella marina]
MASSRVVVVGGGFAGFHAARELCRRLSMDEVEIVVVNPTDYFLYLPLLPEVAVGILDPRRVCVSLPAALPGVRLALGEVCSFSLREREIRYTDAEGRDRVLGYDRLVLAAGSVNKLLPIPGVAEHAHGFRGVPEALYLRDHVVRQIELAAAAEDPAERVARCTFVVVGAGYTGTEVAAQGPAFAAELAARHRELDGQRIRWLLLEVADRVLPSLDERLSRTADTVLRRRGVEVRTGASVHEAGQHEVTLDTGERIGTHTVVWCVGVRPDPLIEEMGVPTRQGRVTVDGRLQVPGQPEVFACGDAAAVPDRTRGGRPTAMTAQHAQRQGTLAGVNVAASLGHGIAREYRHHDLGFVVDLGTGEAAANPLHIPLSGALAKLITRAYHLLALPGNRLYVAIDWLLHAMLRTRNQRHNVELGLIRGPAVPLDSASPELPKHSSGKESTSLIQQ